jgi:hypothetical protein
MSFSPVAVGDIDSTFILDASANLQNRGTTISSVSQPTISRLDQIPVGPNDISVTNVSIIPGGLQIGFTISTGTNATGYRLTFALTLSDGVILVRQCVVVVVPAVQ